MTLKDQKDWPKTRYDSQINNIVTEFFIPALKNSTTYRRIGGLFNSTSLSLAARGISELIKNDGKMQLIVSPILTKEDAQMLDSCSSNMKNEIIHKSLINHLNLEIEFERDHVAALGYLLNKKFLEIKIDLQTNEEGKPLSYDEIKRTNLLDEKLGIFQDRDGNAISFRGPVNENKESWEHGTFSITVDINTISGQIQHVRDDIARFEKIWNNSKTLDLPNQTRSHIVKNSIDKSEIHLEKFDIPEWAKIPDGNILWDHQIRAINSWIANKHRGIFNIATSGGKTLAALVSASLTPKESIILVLVPTRVLMTQWEKEIRQFNYNADLVVCDSDHDNWDTILPGKLSRYVGKDIISEDRRLVILSTMSTAISEKFRNNFEKILSKFITIIADEVHHLGAPEYSKIFEINAQKRLGLSATFTRDWDEIGTNRILDYFEKPVDEIYTVADGIRDKRLSRYEYHLFFAFLNDHEFLEHARYSKEIGKISAMLKHTKDFSLKRNLEIKYRKLLLNRAEIIKKAEDKTNTYKQILLSSPKKPYIVFADDNEQVNKLKKIHKEMIQKINSEKHVDFEKDDIMTFSGKLDDLERNKMLEESKNNQTPMFAMYCLDEGVDVPEFQSAILVSSSASKRQYVQRRGRILRTSVKEKIAHLYDIVVLPNSSIGSEYSTETDMIVAKEKERVDILSKDANNRWEADGIFDRKLKDMGFFHSQV